MNAKVISITERNKLKFQHHVKLTASTGSMLATRCGKRLRQRSPEQVKNLPMCPECTNPNAN